MSTTSRGSKGQVAQKASSSTRSTKSQLSARSSGSQAAAPQKSSSSAPKVKSKEFQTPAYSVPYVPKITESELDKIKKKTIRRNAPPGEDLKSIKTVLKSIKDQNVTVQEFIALIAPSTGDNGAALRAVMNDDLTSFRKLVRKVYDTITQDNSDVLLNQQLQLSEYYKEKKKLLNSRMMNMIEEIYSYAPNFDFDRHAAEGEKYLNEILPIPAELAIEPEEIEMMKRQAAYHRLQWLRSEGERLNEENNSLKKRLTQMKRMHMEEQRKMAQIERMVEQKKEALEAAQEEKRETLEILNQSLEKTIIAQEMSLRQTEDSAVLQPKPTKQTGAVRKVKSKGKTSVRRTRKPKWNEVAASDIEERTLEESRQSEKSRVKEAFHFSPIKTPPPRSTAPKEVSPFHYSPPKSPLAAAPYVPEAQAAAPYVPATQAAINPEQFKFTRARAPRDTWGGFN